VEPISLILSALSAGALAAVQEDAAQAVKDAYAGLKRLLLRRLHGNEAAKLSLAQYEKQPVAWEQPLRAELAAINAGQDDEVLAAVRVLVDHLDSDSAGSAVYRNQFHGPVHGLVQGDNNRVSMKFGGRDSGA
jgi:hypothetical protein